MTDRTQAFIVILDDDYRIGDRLSYPSIHEGQTVALPTDADFIAHAIRSIKGVVSVEPVPIDLQDRMARVRVKNELRDELRKVISTFD